MFKLDKFWVDCNGRPMKSATKEQDKLFVGSDSSIEYYEKKNECNIIKIVMVIGLVSAMVIGGATFYYFYEYNISTFQRAARLMTFNPLIDGHNDLPYQIMVRWDGALNKVDLLENQTEIGLHTDIPRLLEGHVGAVFWAAYVDCNSQLKDSISKTLESMDIIRRINVVYSDYLSMAFSSSDIKRIFGERKIASMIGVEGGHSIDSSLSTLRMFYDAGARYMTLNHNCDTPWSESCCDSRKLTKGLTEFGAGIVKEMNRIGMMVDLSHTADQTMVDAMAATTAPVIFSHSAVRSLCNITRNVPDFIIEKLPEVGGLIMVTFKSSFLVLGGQNVTIDTVVEHMMYIIDKIGVDYVGIGSDYDGVSDLPKGLEDVSKFIYLTEALLEKGLSETDVAKILGGNLLRVFSEVEKESKRLKTNLANESKLHNTTFPGFDQCRTPTV